MTLPAFQGRLTRRQPGPAQLDRRPSCRLTPRDMELLVAVGLHGLLTADLLGLAFFSPDATNANLVSSRLYGRLRRCWLWGYLDRYTLPAPRGALGAVPDLFALGPEAAPLVARVDERALPPADWRPEELDIHFLRHELTVATFWAHLQALVRLRQLRACRWTPERLLRARGIRVRDAATGESLPVLPDGYAELIDASGVRRRLAVEIDRGTLSGARFRRKLRAWERYGGWRGRESDEPACSYLVVTTSWKRLGELWKAGRQEVPEEGWRRYLFADADVLALERFAAAGSWLSLDGEYCALLDGLLPRPAAREKGD